MEIANATCYSTEDIRALWLVVSKVVGETPQGFARDDPAVLQIGYYKPSKNPKYKRLFNYVHVGNTHRSPVRIGIVRPNDLPGSALHKLANAASDVMKVPSEVVKELAAVMKKCKSYYSGCYIDSMAHSISYGLRAKKGSRQKDAKISKKKRLASLGRKIRESERAIRRDKQRIVSHQAEILRNKHKARVLCDALGEAYYSNEASR